MKNNSPEQMSDKSAFDYFKDEKIITGWNMGDTLDAHEKGKSCETAWGNPKATQLLFNGVKDAGFDLVRIPVTWMGHFGPAPEYVIEENFLKRIAEVVRFAQNANFKVIINMHHDGITSKTEKKEGWHSINKARESREQYEKITYQFSRLWKQIATYFKDYGDWLMFEPMNEIHDGNWGDNSKGDQELDDVLRPQMEIINKWNQVFTDTVRETGGNNTNRFLIIPGYCTVPKHTLEPYFVLPNDNASNKQIVTFHYYDPYEFGIEGSQVFWGSDEDKQQVDEDFAPFKKRYVDNSIPVIIGESGAVRQLYPKDKAKEEKARLSRIDYFNHIYDKAKEYGLVPVYWDCGDFSTSGDSEKFGLINRTTGKPDSEECEVLIKAMTKK
jgi:endoglucanase